MDYREVIAKNLVELRTQRHITQFQLAQVLNYSDKAVSKWERAESVPDIAVLKQIADFFGVTVDYLLQSEHTAAERGQQQRAAQSARNRLIISCLATSLVWLIATILFVVLRLALPREGVFPIWLLYVYALPISFLLILVFNSLWGKRKCNFLIISLMIWTLLLSIYLSIVLMLHLTEIWMIFVLGIPAQIIVVLWAGLVPQHSKTRGGS